MAYRLVELTLNQHLKKIAMAIPQWKRAEYIIEKLDAADGAGVDIHSCRSEIVRSTESRFKSVHNCLLLAVFGFYKNGLIQNTVRPKATDIDFTGFNGDESDNIHHAFDAIKILAENPSISANQLKTTLGGDNSIYSFVVSYFRMGMLRIED